MRKINKRGDIPVTILVIGVVAVCIMAIFSFYTVGKITKNSLNSVGIIQKASVAADKIALYKNLGFTNDEIDKAFDVKVQDGTRYVSFNEEDLSVKYNLP